MRSVSARPSSRRITMMPATLAAASIIAAMAGVAAATNAGAVEGAHVATTTSSATTFSSSLSEPITACLSGRSYVNRTSPIFRNCMDWHSSVHAHASLYTLTRITGNSSYATTAENRINQPSAISSELSYMRSKVARTSSDNPYGFAWMLRLVAERERATGQQNTRGWAEYIAQSFASGLPGNVTTGATEYHNRSWPVLNLLDWASHTSNSSLLQTARGQAVELKSTPCSAQNDTGSASEFFPACLMKIAAVATAEGPSARAWVDQEMPAGFRVPPLPNSGPSHSMSQNFFRAFALARIANATGRTDLRDNAAELLNWQMARPTVWTTNYTSWSHWIAQIGVLALQEIVKPVTAPAAPATSATTTHSAAPSSSALTSAPTSSAVTSPMPTVTHTLPTATHTVPWPGSTVPGEGTSTWTTRWSTTYTTRWTRTMTTGNPAPTTASSPSATTASSAPGPTFAPGSPTPTPSQPVGTTAPTTPSVTSTPPVSTPTSTTPPTTDDPWLPGDGGFIEGPDGDAGGNDLFSGWWGSIFNQLFSGSWWGSWF